MKMIFKSLSVILAIALSGGSCKKSNDNKTGSNSQIAGFWTYKEDIAVDYWNQNILFKSDGTFLAFTALSLADTSAGPALADTANQFMQYGTYTVSGKHVVLVYTQFASIGFKIEADLQGNNNNLMIGNVVLTDTTTAEPLVYLTKP
jgi:hypothetical protein